MSIESFNDIHAASQEVTKQQIQKNTKVSNCTLMRLLPRFFVILTVLAFLTVYQANTIFSNFSKKMLFQKNFSRIGKSSIPHQSAVMKDLPEDYRSVAFQLAQNRFESRLSGSTNPALAYSSLHEMSGIKELPTKKGSEILNLVRVPKAASSSLSLVARALTGCKPDGFPCMANHKYQANDTSSMQSLYPGNLMCKAILGCTNHHPKYPDDIPIVTGQSIISFLCEFGVARTIVVSLFSFLWVYVIGVRDINDRLLSGFFYRFPHRPHPRNNYTWEFFVNDYIQDPKYRNVHTKMLNGHDAYSPFDSSTSSVQKAKARLCDTASFALSHQPIAFALLLYESQPFRAIIPNPVVFELPAVDDEEEGLDGINTTLAREILSRVDNCPDYAYFKEHTFVEHNGPELVAEYNAEDLEVYKFAVELYCARVREAGLIEAAEQHGLERLYQECLTEEIRNTKTTTSAELCTQHQLPLSGDNYALA